LWTEREGFIPDITTFLQALEFVRFVPEKGSMNVTEPEDYRQAGTWYALKFFLLTFSFKKK